MEFHRTIFRGATFVADKAAPGLVEQVGGEIEAAVADARQLPVKGFGQVTGATRQLNYPRRAR